MIYIFSFASSIPGPNTSSLGCGCAQGRTCLLSWPGRNEMNYRDSWWSCGIPHKAGRGTMGVWMGLRGPGIPFTNPIHPGAACQAPRTSAGVVPETGLCGLLSGLPHSDQQYQGPEAPATCPCPKYGNPGSRLEGERKWVFQICLGLNFLFLFGKPNVFSEFELALRKMLRDFIYWINKKVFCFCFFGGGGGEVSGMLTLGSLEMSREKKKSHSPTNFKRNIL